MSDMPDEVLIDRRMHAWRPEDWRLLDPREGQVRYIRADLYEQRIRDVETASARLSEQLAQYTDVVAERDRLREQNRNALASIMAVADQRDRLRAALKEIRDWPEDWRRDGNAVAAHFQAVAESALNDG